MSSYRVLIIEKDPNIRDALRQGVESAGHRVVEETVALDQARVDRGAYEAVLLGADQLAGVVSTSDEEGECEDSEESLAGKIDAALVIVASEAQLGEVAIRHQVSQSGAFGTVAYPFTTGTLLSALDIAIQRFAEINDCHTDIDHLQHRLDDRILIERAKGLLMQQGRTEPEAFLYIQHTARRQNRRMRAVAEEIMSGASAQV